MTNENPSSQDPGPVESPAEPSSIPPPGATPGEPARTRKRWIAAAAAALGVALFAVPLLRGPLDRPSPPSQSGGAPVVGKASGPSCEAKASAHLDFTLKDIDGVLGTGRLPAERRHHNRRAAAHARKGESVANR